MAYDLTDYIADNYGTCKRGTDCYWGKTAMGRSNGCLNPAVGWKGRLCPYWIPVTATTWGELITIQKAEGCT